MDEYKKEGGQYISLTCFWKTAQIDMNNYV